MRRWVLADGPALLAGGRPRPPVKAALADDGGGGLSGGGGPAAELVESLASALVVAEPMASRPGATLAALWPGPSATMSGSAGASSGKRAKNAFDGLLEPFL